MGKGEQRAGGIRGHPVDKSDTVEVNNGANSHYYINVTV